MKRELIVILSFVILMNFSLISAKLTSSSTKVPCTDITGGSDYDYCVDASGNGTGGGGNTTEEIQDAVGSGFTGNLSYNDPGNSFDIDGADILTWLNGFYRRLDMLIGTLDIATMAITAIKIASGAVNTTHILDGTIIDADLNLSNITLNDFTNDINIGNWTLDKPSYTPLTTLNNGSYFNVAETDPLAYNGTLVAINILNNGSYFNVANGGTKVNNITCSGTDKVSSYDNVTGNFVCTTDQTGAGSGVSFNVVNRTYVNVTTSSNTAYTLLYTVPMSANKNVTLECNLLQWANAATVGVQYTFNFTGTGIRAFHLSGTYYTSTTAEAIIPYSEKSNGGNSVILSPLTSAGAVASPTRLQGWVSTNGSDANFLVRFRSETATSTGIMKGSYCRTIEQ